jgi:hypothetical protein
LQGDDWSITQESNRSGRGDSSRFLAAGAEAAFLVETAEGRLLEAMPAIQSKLGEAENAIIESNSILEFIEPDLYIAAVDPATGDFKASALKYFDRADAVVLHERETPERQAFSFQVIAGRSVFRIVPPQYVTDDLVEFVAHRLKARSGSHS